MTIEDLIKKSAISDVEWERNDHIFLYSVYGQVEGDRALTTKQAHVAIKIMRKHAKKLAKSIGLSKEQLLEKLDNPKYDQTPRTSVTRRNEVRYAGDNLLAFSCNHTEEIRNFMRLHKNAHYVNGVLMVGVSASNFNAIIDLLAVMAFEMDEDTEKYLALCLASANKESHLIACDDLIVCNVCDNDVLGAFILQMCDGEVV